MAALRQNQDHFRIFCLTELPGCASLGMVAYVLPEGMLSRGAVQDPFSRRGFYRKSSSLVADEPSRQFVGFLDPPDRKT